MRFIIEEMVRKRFKRYWRQWYDECDAEERADKDMEDFTSWLFEKYCKETNTDRIAVEEEW